MRNAPLVAFVRKLLIGSVEQAQGHTTDCPETGHNVRFDARAVPPRLVDARAKLPDGHADARM